MCEAKSVLFNRGSAKHLMGFREILGTFSKEINNFMDGNLESMFLPFFACNILEKDDNFHEARMRLYTKMVASIIRVGTNKQTYLRVGINMLNFIFKFICSFGRIRGK